MEITIRKALQMKKTLAGDLAKARVKISSHNVQEESRVSSHINILDLLAEQEQILAKLLALKTAVTLANVPVYPKLVLADELRSQIAWYESLSTDETREKVDYKNGNSVVKNVVGINESVKTAKVKELKSQLEAVLDEVDFYNGSTKIKVEI